MKHWLFHRLLLLPISRLVESLMSNDLACDSKAGHGASARRELVDFHAMLLQQ
mgnify:CR=1 FL=1|jgi:hypothetical protein